MKRLTGGWVGIHPSSQGWCLFIPVFFPWGKSFPLEPQCPLTVEDEQPLLHRGPGAMLCLVCKALGGFWLRVVLSFLTLRNYCLNILVF